MATTICPFYGIGLILNPENASIYRWHPCPHLCSDTNVMSMYSDGVPLNIKCIFFNGDLIPTEDSCYLLKMCKSTVSDELMGKHIHDKHRHQYNHAGIDIEDGPPFGKYLNTAQFKMPDSNKLITEYTCNEDLDGNGLIYGKDFAIANTPSRPTILGSIEQDPSFQTPSKSITWEQYLNKEYPTYIPQITSVSLITNDSIIDSESIYILIEGKYFTTPGYEYMFDKKDDPYPGYYGADFSSFNYSDMWIYDNWSYYENNSHMLDYSSLKDTWEANRGNDITWETFHSNNRLVLKIGDYYIPQDYIIDHKMNRIIAKIYPLNNIISGQSYNISIVDHTSFENIVTSTDSITIP